MYGLLKTFPLGLFSPEVTNV